ncbi:MAG TPA: adenine phosphoribosyltransferase [Candidatus Pelethenecus faecipullorum]|uniref:Adenine phosphoribosyltransferase n=1 Tax=Candidatus Pelethenecus faecipullorum TaxID=2840900 RepID=A0A9D1GSD6_9MOLU|nr:adenine phosphoribosyltransferase [Candidatus Pelethenecus faecipullorum]
MNLKDYVATIMDYPKKGIVFRDITPLMGDGAAYRYACDKITAFAKEKQATMIVGPEARGFIFGCPVATNLKIGFAPIRKPGKLPRETIFEEYTLEYGTNTLCIHADALKKGDKVVIIDDLLATGGTVKATINLCERLGAEVVGVACLIELLDLKGRDLLKQYDVLSLMTY